jgi:hypothetical protein
MRGVGALSGDQLCQDNPQLGGPDERLAPGWEPEASLDRNQVHERLIQRLVGRNKWHALDPLFKLV